MPHNHNQHHRSDHAHGGHDHHAMMVADFRRRFWVSLALTLPVLALSPMIRSFVGLRDTLAFPGDSRLLFAFSTVIFVYGGKPFLTGLVDELRNRAPGMMTLIGLAITVAYVYSAAVTFGLSGKVFYWELATLIDVMLLGHWIEMRSVMGASMAVESLVKLLPSDAHKVVGDSTRDVPVEQLNPGDRVVIKPGEKVPVDGVILKGATSVNEAMLTGESTPVAKRLDDKVVGGSVNGEGSITVEVRKTGKDSYLSQVVEMVRNAQQGKSRTQNFADRAAAWLAGIAVTVGVATFAVWLFGLGQSFVFALERAVTVMVITCPHALGLAIPLVVAVSTARSASRGLLIRRREGFERGRAVDAVVFDKTGTLTRGEFGVTETAVFGRGMSEEKLIALAASVEAESEHPIARAIVEKAGDNRRPVDNFRAISGRGAEGRVDGKAVKVVSPRFADEQGISYDRSRVEALRRGGRTVVVVIVGDDARGAIALADIVRSESKSAIARLKRMGIRTMMVTGDNRTVAEAVARELDLDEFFAEVLPDKKVEKIKEVQGRGMLTAMVGDGINDAPALAQADVGIAIGAGTDVAAETADIVLVRSDPRDVVTVIALAKATHRKMIQNLLWATGYNVLAIPAAAGVFAGLGIMLSPAMGAVLMSVSTVIVAINARFLNIESD